MDEFELKDYWQKLVYAGDIYSFFTYTKPSELGEHGELFQKAKDAFLAFDAAMWDGVEE